MYAVEGKLESSSVSRHVMYVVDTCINLHVCRAPTRIVYLVHTYIYIHTYMCPQINVVCIVKTVKKGFKRYSRCFFLKFLRMQYKIWDVFDVAVRYAFLF